jgi:hypothetical protein
MSTGQSDFFDLRGCKAGNSELSAMRPHDLCGGGIAPVFTPWIES